MEIFTAAPHHDVLVLIAQIALLLFSARALGEVAQRLGQPSVVGEILAGILLGPSLLSGLVPALGVWIVPQSEVSGYLLEVVSLIGAMFLLLITGLETDLALIRRHARTAIGVSLGGVLVTFSSGFLLGQLLPDFLLAEGGSRLVFAMFVGTALSISAIPVIAKVMMDLNLMRRDIGQTIIAAGMSDDTVGWILLSVVAGLASGEAVTAKSVLSAISSVLAFMVVSFTLGRMLVRQALEFVQDRALSRDRLLSLVVVFTFAWGALTQALNLEAVLGAFVMGILFGTMRRLPEEVHHKLESVALGIFAPIFFAVAGLKVNLVNLASPQLILIALLVIFVATAGKVLGTYLGARLIGRRDHWTSLAFGAGLNARGAMEIIIATIGLQLGILNQDMFSIIVLMAMATSLMAPTALRFVLARVKPEAQELARLKQEELTASSLVARIHRVLLPMRQRNNGYALQTVEAQILAKMAAKNKLSVTLLTVSEAGGKARGQEFLNRVGQLFAIKEVQKKVVESDEVHAVILDEAKKDYDLMILGASEKDSTSKVLFNPMVDYLLRVAPCPTMVIRGGVIRGGVIQGRPHLENWALGRILVPTNGSQAARSAAELAFSLVGGEDEIVIVLNVVTPTSSVYHLDADGAGLERQLGSAHQNVNELRELGQARGVRVDAKVRLGSDPENVILEIARLENIDLIMLGTNIRPVSDRLFLGPRVERILERAPCPVLILNT